MLAGSYVMAAGEVQVTGSVDKDRVQIDEELSLTVRVVGARGNLQAPRLPAFQGFDSFYTGRTSQFTFVNGKSSATVEFNYVLVPKVVGRFTLAPVEVWIEGKRYSTEPINVDVLGPQIQSPPAVQPAPAPLVPRTASTLQPPPSPTPPAGPPLQVSEDANVFARAWLDKKTVYPNEQILLTYTLYTRYDTRYEGFEEEPTVSGFWIEDFPLDRDLGKETVTVEGRRYVKADVRKIALFPTSPAHYTIQPGLLKVSVQEQPRTTSIFDDFFNDSFFSGAGFFSKRVDRLLKPEPLEITVRPLPETGKPASFTGAVGRFRLDASVDKKELKQNEPLTLKLVIEGEGNLETLPRPPVPELTGFKIYDGDSSTQLFKSGTTISGKKTFEVIFIPTEAGQLAVPPVEFSFFDPRSERYQTLRTPSFPLEVAASEESFVLPAELAQKQAYQKEVELEAHDIRFIHEEAPSGRRAKLLSVLLRLLAAGNVAGLALVGGGIFKRRQEELFARNVGLRRRRTARALALQRLKGLKRLVGDQETEGARKFMDEAEGLLSEYFSNKFNASGYSFTREWLDEKLTGLWGTGEPLLKQIHEFYDLSGEARFGRGDFPAAKRREFCRLIEDVIRRLEKEREERLK